MEADSHHKSSHSKRRNSTDSHPHAKVGMIMCNDGGDNYVYDGVGDDYYAMMS